MRAPTLLLLLACAACATTPHAWQEPGTGVRASAEEIMSCQTQAEFEARNSAMMWGWPGYGIGAGFIAGPRRVSPGFGGFYGFSSPSFGQRVNELTSFCLRVKGYRYLPVAPVIADTPAPGPAPGSEKMTP